MYACMYVCVYVCMHVCTYLCMHACRYVCVCMYACTYECMCAGMHACKHVCIYIYIHIYIYIMCILLGPRFLTRLHCCSTPYARPTRSYILVLESSGRGIPNHSRARCRPATSEMLSCARLSGPLWGWFT